ncbi:tetratricopeptide repeat protein [Helicobacter suis]|uniref:tetratricopeptide repeat protein n=1 Tax=Helicobacter suis TaxID=104628 RepID=UPI000CF082AA|nr:tetratricopeptide repeat protein [Helicobacter suis]
MVDQTPETPQTPQNPQTQQTQQNPQAPQNPQNPPKRNLIQTLQLFFSQENPLLQILQAKTFQERFTALKSRPRLYLSVLGGTGLVALIVIVSLIMSFVAHNRRFGESSAQKQAAAQQSRKLSKIEQSQDSVLNNLPVLKETPHVNLNEEHINTMIEKADILYRQGQTDEALRIFDKISHISSNLANHNLGVLKMHQKDYSGALKFFDNALLTKENISINAIDAMISAFYLNNMDLYTRYLKLTTNYLVQLDKQPIYPYTYALSLYYGGHYFETLSALINPDTELFSAPRNRLAAKIFMMFGDEANAIKYLKNAATPKDDKTLGLLYARLGDYDRAIQSLRRYNDAYPDDQEALMALELIALRMGNFIGAQDVLASLLHTLKKDKHKEKILSDTYPIEPRLNRNYFDVQTIRRSFWSNNLREGMGMLIVRILFYYAPFKLMDLKSSLNAIHEGMFSINAKNNQDFIDAINSLEKGKNTSSADLHMIAAFKHLGTSHLRLALKEFKLSLEANPYSSTAHYNTGLIYAQLDDFHNASFHFKKAYYLNNNNVLAGIFAVLTERIDYRDSSALLKKITTDFQSLHFKDRIQRDFLNSFINYLNDTNNDDLSWMDRTARPLSIHYALGIAYAHRANDKKRLIKYSSALKKMHPKDIFTNVLCEILLKYKGDIHQMLGAYAFLTSKKVDLDKLIHGSVLARKIYIYMGFITGLSNSQEETLNARLSAASNDEDRMDLLRMLGLMSLFQKKYEKAVSIYNFLLDKAGDHEMEVYELASLSYIALKRFDSAALVLELAKNIDPQNYDVRFGLGLLYQRLGDLESALTNFNLIKSYNFHSIYYQFQIKAPKNAQDLP